MSNEPVVTFVGNATGDAELKATRSGAMVATWTLAQTPRVKQGDEYVDGEPIFVRCSAWRDLGEHAADSITRGMRLIVQGRMKVRSWEQDGVKRTGIECEVEAVGPDLRYATAKIMKAGRSEGGQQRPSRARSRSADYDSEPPF
jgi:single-strand DNA-binding protein